MAASRNGSALGDRLVAPVTIWDRVIRWGLFCVALGAIISTIIAAFVYLILPFSVLFAPVALALVVVYLLNPLVSMLSRRMRRGLAVAIVYVAFVAVVAVALSLIVPIIARQITGFIGKLPEYVEDITTEVNTFAAKRGWDFRIDLAPEQIRQYVVDNRDAIIGVLGGVRSFAFSVLHILVTLVIGIILSVYILLDLPKIQQTVRSLLPGGRREELAGLGEKVGGVLGSFFRGQLLVALFVGVTSAIGLTVIGIPFAAVVGLIAGVFNLVPLIGPFVGAVPAVILALLSDQPIDALWAGIWLLVVQQIDNHIISPNVMARTVKLHPITVMLALLAAGSLFGIFGMLLIVPAVAAVKLIAAHLWEKRSVRAAIADALPDGATPAVVTEAVVEETVVAVKAEPVKAEPAPSEADKAAALKERLVSGPKKARRTRGSAARRTTRGSRAGRKRKRS